MQEFTHDPSGTSMHRRELLAGGAALGASVGLGVLGAWPQAAWAQGAPKKGGKLRIGMTGGSASDNLDPTTYNDSIINAVSAMLWNCLVEIDDAGNAVGELAESWQTKSDAKEWIFNLRKGITFTSGKTFDADDVIYSLNLHRGPTKSPAKVTLEDVAEINKLSATQVQFKLKSGNADFPYNLSDYHFVMVPADTKDFSKPDGTGAYALESFQPGIRAIFKRKPGGYFKPGRGNFDAVELRYIIDDAARTQALLTGQIDVMNKVNPKTADLFAKNAKFTLSRTPAAGARYCFIAQVDADPFKSRDLMLALKWGIDREKIISNVFNGYATPGADHTMGPTQRFYNKNIKPRAYDPEKAAFHLKKSGFTDALTLVVSDGAFPGCIDSGVIFQEAFTKMGGKLQVKRASADGYWDQVWLKSPFCAAFWSARPTADLQLSTMYASNAAWNDSHYRNPEVDALLATARVELDAAKRSQQYYRLQQLIHDEAGTINFAVTDYLDACTVRLKGLRPSGRFDMGDHRIAEKGWFA